MQNEQMDNTRESGRTRTPRQASAAIWRARGRAVGLELLWGCAAWLLGRARMAFGTYPLGVALLCASPRHTVSILAGLILTSVSNLDDGTVYICTYLAAALIRVFASLILDSRDTRIDLPEALRKKLFSRTEGTATQESAVPLPMGFLKTLRAEVAHLFSESLRLRMTAAGISALIVGLYHIIRGGFQYYDFFAALFAIVTASAGVMVFSIALEKHCRVAWMKHLSEAMLLFAVIFASHGVSMLSLPVSPMIALFFTLYVCHTRGGVSGIVASLVCGVAYAPLMAPGCLLAALTYLFLVRSERRGAVLLASLAMLLWSSYAAGMIVLLRLLPAILLAGAGFTVTRNFFLQKEDEPAEDAADTRTERQMASGRHRDANERFRGISDAFSSLSEVFYNLSDRFRRPGALDLRRICDRSFDQACGDCPNKSVCWGLEYGETLAGVNQLITQLHTKGRVDRTQLPRQLQHRCSQIDGILEEINRECARLTGEMLRNNRTEIFAMDYEAAANIINEALEEEDGEYRNAPETERKIAEYLSDAGVRFGSVTVYGNRRRKILVRGVDVDHAKVSFETLCSDVGELCSSKLAPPTFEVEDHVSTMILCAEQKIAVTGAQNNVSADGGVSGDSLNLFSNKKDYFYALISDGMGAGKEAALTSNLCSIFLEKMLRAGNRAGTSLRMLNNMIRSRGEDSRRECSSTIDLLELDLMSGNASFIKSGAAPGFVIRGNVVRRLHAGTVPIGIICTLDAQTTTFELQPGDTVVMISDGILQRDAECEWITSYLKTVGDLTPEEIVYRICLHAAEAEEHDDCSAIALRIHAAGEVEREDQAQET